MPSLVAVTGADGFIGSHLVEQLVAGGARVRAMALYNSFGTWGWLDTLSDNMMNHVDVVMGDVRDPGSTLEFMREAEVVYHLAALIGIPYSYRAPHSYVATNITGTLNVLEGARSLGTPRVVLTSTSEVYGTARHVPITEQHPLQAQSPYAASKIAADKLGESYHASFGVPVVILRPFNTFGPRQSDRAIIPTIISQSMAGEGEVTLGALDPTRDFTFATDTASAFVAVGTAPTHEVVGGVFNAGTGVEVSIADLAATISGICGRRLAIRSEEKRRRPAASEVMRLVSDSSHLRDVTGWRPSVSLEQGLEKTIQWFSEPHNLARYRTERYAV